ncbi:MAG: hypothetical protein AAB929_03620 [Patescibacteria group bacterium]
MNKLSIYKTIGIILLIILLSSILLYLNRKPAENSDHIRIINLARSFAYEQILNEFSNYSWNLKKDPAMLMIYCEALVESRKEFPHSLKSPPLPAYMAEFAQAYYNLLSGEIGDAFVRFYNLTNNQDNQDSEIWGYIGLLEALLYSENIENMEFPLEKMQTILNQYASSVPSWVIPYYSAWYYFYSGKFSEVEKTLQRYSKNLDPVTFIDLKVQLLIRENHFKEAIEAIKNLPPELLNDQDIIDLESYIIQLESGHEAEVKYLHEKHKRFPYMWLIEQRYAEALIESGQIDLGVDIFKKLASKRPFDIHIQINLSEKLLYNEKKEVRDILNKLRNNPNVIQLPQFNVLLAQIFWGSGKKDIAQKYLDRARKLYPKNPYLLWLIYDIAMEKHDYDKANQALKEILELYPNEISVLASIVELNYLRGEWDELFLTEKKISQSPRYISEETLDKVKSFKAMAFAAQGKFDEVEKILAEIKETDTRARIATKIDKYRKVTKEPKRIKGDF